MTRTDLIRLIAPITLATATLLSCARGAPPPAAGPEPAGDLQAGALPIPPLPLPPMARPGEEDAEPGLTFRLREGAPDATPPTPAETETSGPSAVQPLDAARTARLIARLPALPSPDTVGFRFPPASPPPPRTGRIMLSPFPPPDTVAPPPPDARAASPLRVVRVVPTGDTELAPHLTITFSEAMVPLTTVAGTETRTPPVRLTPQSPGRWSWVDTRTLRFQPDERFPMATSYSVEVPAGTRPVTGPALDTTVTVEFSTPAPRAIGAWPALHPEMTAEEQRRRSIHPRWDYGDDLARSTTRQPVVLIAFDQRVSPEDVLSATRIIAAGLSHPVRLASRAEVAADSIVSRMVDELEGGRWVALRPVAPLPADTTVTVVLARGLSSAEGPLSTLVPQELRFRTYGPLRIAQHGCGADCRPGYTWNIHFTNPLADAPWSELVRVEPALDDMSIRVYGSDMQISGDARPNTRYVVTLSTSLTDRFGQALEGPRSVTFDVREAHPTIALPGAPLIVLDPEGPPRVAFQSQGHDALRVRVYRVTPQQWNEYGMAVQRWHQEPGEIFSPPGELVSSTVISAAASGELTEALIDVAPALRNGLGHAIVAISAEGTPSVDESGRRARNVVHAWVQSTRIGLEATIDAEAAHVWASSLRTGQPLADVAITLLPTRTRAVTRADGTARLPLTTSGDDALTATLGDDVALLPSSEYPSPRGSGSSWQRRPTGELRWYMLTDRGLYQPGDTLHFKGWLRHMAGSTGSALRLAGDVDAIRFTMRGPRGEDLGTRSLRPGDLGGFNTTVALPEAMNLGHASIQLEAGGGDAARNGREAYHAVQVQEFRRPEYEVRVEADPGPHIVGDVIAVTLAADYYGGGGLADAQLDWRVSTQPGSYTPPGWERWHFGRAQWGWAGISPREPGLLSGVTDAAGTHQLLIDLLSVEPPFTTSLRAEAQVHDVTRQIGSAGVDLLVHPAAVDVGLRMERTWLRPGQTGELDVIVVDHDGAEVTGRRVSVVLERLRGGWRMGGSAEPDSGRVVCSVLSGTTPVPCTFTADSSGLHRIRADVSDAEGRISRTELTLWVAGEPGLPDPRRQPGSFDVVADREEYQPGDTARILLQPPFHPAEALVTIRSGGVLDTRRLRIERASHELILPITAEHIPNINVRVEVVDAERGVSRAFGETSLSVPPHTRGLDVRILPGAAVAAPGGNVTIDVEVHDDDGRAAAGAEVALWMVDEAILGLGNYSLRDPLAAFYSPRYGYMQDLSSRSWVVLWPQSAGPGTLSGVVVLGDRGHALAGAVVRLAGTDIETVTDWDGSFTLRGIAPGDYVLEITAADGMSGRRSVHAPAEGVHVGNLILGPAGLGAAWYGAARDGAVQAQELSAAAVSVAMPPPPAPPPPPGAPTAPEVALRSIVVTGNSAAQDEVSVRTDFAPLAFFAPSLRTDANGRVQVTARLPETLTRYRIMAVAVSGAQRFGTGDAAVTARRDLMVRLSAPRFLNYGDAFELPVLVQNVTARTMQVEVAARAAGVSIPGSAGRLVTLAPGARAEVRFEAAAPLPGNAHVQVIAAAAGSSDPAVSDAAAADIPVYTPATLEAFATYGTIASSAPVVLPLARPENVISGFGGLEVSITSTALHSLTDAVLYLHRYPFEGSEHIASRLLSIAALRDVLAAFAAEGLPGPDSLVTSAQRDIADLVARQNDDGGWSFWRGYALSHPFVSIHVAHALQRAHERGFDVSPDALRRATEYLRTIETHTARWPQRVRQSAAAYALYVRDRIGDPQAAGEARRLATTAPDRVGGELPIEAAGWLLHVLADDPSSSTAAAELRRTLVNRLVETAGSVTFAAQYEDGEHLLLHSRRRTDAVLLEALIAADADADIVTRLAQSLLAHRTAGRWSGTQENAWVLLALDRYFRTYEATTPAFESRVWLDESFAGTHAFRGRTTERQHIDIPMPELLRRDADELIIARAGEGRMYYRAGLRYAPSDPRVPQTNRGFEVGRTYEAVDDPADVRQAGDGSWHIRAGARVRVRVSMVAPSVRFHAALIDPMPAGFEPLNPELTGTGFTDDPGAIEPDARRFGMWRPTWFEHQNLRDDRAEAFAALLPAGAYEYTYLVRATTPGRFIVPPPRAEMMYQPETFGRGRGEIVIIE